MPRYIENSCKKDHINYFDQGFDTTIDTYKRLLEYLLSRIKPDKCKHCYPHIKDNLIKLESKKCTNEVGDDLFLFNLYSLAMKPMILKLNLERILKAYGNIKKPEEYINDNKKDEKKVRIRR